MKETFGFNKISILIITFIENYTWYSLLGYLSFVASGWFVVFLLNRFVRKPLNIFLKNNFDIFFQRKTEQKNIEKKDGKIE